MIVISIPAIPVIHHIIKRSYEIRSDSSRILDWVELTLSFMYITPYREYLSWNEIKIFLCFMAIFDMR